MRQGRVVRRTGDVLLILLIVRCCLLLIVSSCSQAAHHCQNLCHRLLCHMLIRCERRCAGWCCLCTQVMAMTNLVAAYQANDIREFEKILQQNKWVKRGRNGRGLGSQRAVWRPGRYGTGCCLRGQAQSGDRCLHALQTDAGCALARLCVVCQQCWGPWSVAVLCLLSCRPATLPGAPSWTTPLYGSMWRTCSQRSGLRWGDGR